MDATESAGKRFELIEWALDERLRRFLAAAEAKVLGRGGVAAVATFAVQTILRWWQAAGKVAYPDATDLMVTADGGGSNGSRVRLWKVELQRLADETGLAIRVCHFPPGTSKWNKIEHRLFFLHQHELARPTPRQPRGDDQPDSQYAHPQRLASEGGT
jgi:hypothetical protein